MIALISIGAISSVPGMCQ